MSEIPTYGMEKEEKRRFGNKKIIIVLLTLGILLAVIFVSAAVVGGSFLIPKSVTGAWELVENPEVPASTADEIPESDKAYYVFEKPDKYGRGEYYTCYQGGVEYYKYELLEENKVNKINLGSEDMEYSITGSKLLGNATLTVIFPAYTDDYTGAAVEAQEYVFKQAKAPEYEKQSYKDYNTDSGIFGEKYTSNERTLSYYYYYFSYVQTIEFTDDGIMIIHYESSDLGLNRYMYYAYTVNNGELTFSLVTDKETKYKVSYELDDNGNLRFSNDTTSNSIFADAVFGEFTFYTAENLPEPTVASSDEMYFTE